MFAAGDEDYIAKLNTLAAGILGVAAVQSANFTAATGFIYPIDTNDITVTLPLVPAEGARITLARKPNASGVYRITVNPNGKSVDGSSSSEEVVLYDWIEYYYIGGAWYTRRDYLKNLFIGRRNIIPSGNFDLNPWQRGTSFTGLTTATTKTADRWKWFHSGSATVTVSKSAFAPTVAECGVVATNSMRINPTVADASVAAGDYAGVMVSIEGYDWANLAQRECVLTFWHAHSKTGTYCVSLINSTADRSLVLEYTQSAADTWEKATLRIPASPSAGTWNYTTGIGVTVRFGLMAGTTFQTATTGAWATGNFMATSAQVNAMDSTSNVSRFALVQLEPGVVPTPFELWTFEEVLAHCLRYFEKSFELGTAPAQGIGSVSNGPLHVNAHAANQNVNVFFKVRKRVAPTIVTYNPIAANANWRDNNNNVDRNANVGAASESGVSIFSGAFVASTHNYIHYTADAEL
jgi:hypothetical protein